MTKVDVFTNDQFLRQHRSSYEHLSQISPWATPFQTLPWLDAMLQFRKPPMWWTVFQGQDLLAAYPFIHSKSPWKALRPFGNGPCDYLGPLVHPDSESEVCELFSGWIEERAKVQLVDLHQMPSDHPITQRLLADSLPATQQATCLKIDLAADFKEYVSGLSKSMRYDVRRIDGKFLQEKDAQVVWMDESNRSQCIDVLFDLHKARWRSRGLPGAFIGSAEKFQRAWLASPNATSILRINMLLLEGKPIGVIYGMVWNRTFYFYQAGLQSGTGNVSPGTILVAKMIERAIEEGATRFDLMRGDEPYKRRWKPTVVEKNFRITSASSGLISKLGMQVQHTTMNLEQKVRDRIEGKSLIPSRKSRNQNEPK